MRKYTHILLACIAGFLSILPYLYVQYQVEPYGETTFQYFYQDSELIYLSRIREVVEGELYISSPAFSEYKEAQSIQQPFGEWMYAVATFGNPEIISFVALVSKFLLPAMLFLILYLLALELLSGSRWEKQTSEFVALFVATMVVLGYDLINVEYVRQVFTHTFTAPQLSLWTRLVNPIFGALGFFMVSYLVLILRVEQSAWRTILAGLLLGFTSCYIFSFALGMVFVVVMLGFALFEKRWNRVKSFVAVIAIALLVDSVYLHSLLTISSEITALQKNGLLLTHQVLHNKVLYIALTALLVSSAYSYIKRRSTGFSWKNGAWQWQVSAVLAGLVCLNEQVITGKTVWPGHFVQYTNPLGYIIFSISILTIVGTFLQNKSEKYKVYGSRVIVGGCSIGILALCAINLSTVSSVVTNQDEFQNIQRYTPAVEWLNKNTDETCVVFPVEEFEELGQYIPAYTPCDVYYSTYVFFAVPEERIMHNYILHLRLHGITEEKLRTYLDSHENDMRLYFFADWADKFSDGHDTWVFNTKPFEERVSFIERSKLKVQKAYLDTKEQTLNELLLQYTVHYLIIDQERTDVSLDTLGFIKVYEANGIKIYKIN